MLATFPVVIIGAMVFGRFIRKLSKERQEELAESNNILQETMQAIQAVKAFTNELFETVRYGKRIDQVVRIALGYARWRALLSFGKGLTWCRPAP
jgi:ABC-type bacteriocin/lantibiotic exporter with double-glycine peptidase domain